MKQNGKHTGGGAILESGQEVQLKKTEKKVYNVFDMGESALVGKGDFNALKCLFLRADCRNDRSAIKGVGGKIF